MYSILNILNETELFPLKRLPLWYVRISSPLKKREGTSLVVQWLRIHPTVFREGQFRGFISCGYLLIKKEKQEQCIFRVHAKQKCLIRNNFEKKKVKVAQSCLTSQHYGLVHGILQGRILESVPISFSRGSNPGLPHCRRILYYLIHQGSPRILEWVAYPFSSGSS